MEPTPTGLTWRISTFSGANDNCVAVAALPGGGRAVRNSKHPDGPVVTFTASEWDAFVKGVKADEFDG
ncbi:DUF397 domain-containing protein [Streptosporangium canum]|uniref:DUF397 domain-containing protein n=1 Tax=Streptosporangium canum TaxID=324952 RepID=UPI0033A51598